MGTLKTLDMSIRQRATELKLSGSSTDWHGWNLRLGIDGVLAAQSNPHRVPPIETEIIAVPKHEPPRPMLLLSRSPIVRCCRPKCPGCPHRGKFFARSPTARPSANST